MVMESVLRRLGLKKNDGKESDARRQLQKELFLFQEPGDCGYPRKPSAVAFDSKLSLLAIGTRTGAIKIYGRPGVYISAQHSGDVEVTKMCFLPEQARLVTLCSDNTLHLWEYNEKDGGKASLDETKTFAVENNKLKMVSSWFLTSNGDSLILGTDGGNVHFFDISTFSLTDKAIYQDVIIQNAPEDFKVNPGAIEAVLQHPNAYDKYLIGFTRGLIVLWDTTENKPDYTYNAAQQLESAVFNHDGSEFHTAHADGSYATWTTAESSRPKDNPVMPYGPFPCKAITSINWQTGKTGPWTIISGGMPRANFQDKNTISIIHGDANVVLDFTSRVIDFFTISSDEQTTDAKIDPHTLLVLTEEELVAVDLLTDGWPTYRLPYLANLDARSPVTSVQHVAGISETLWNNIINTGNKQFSQSSPREWPIVGGQLVEQVSKHPSGLLTGHADGSVSFWDVSLAGGISLLCTLDTSDVFALDTLNTSAVCNGTAEEEWPPFRKVGTKRSLTDEPRLAVRKLSFCAATDTLFVGGAGGQVTVFKVGVTDVDHVVERHVVDITGKPENSDWSGPEALAVKSDPAIVSGGFQAVCVVQVHPATTCTTMAHDQFGQLLAVATEHGLGVFDLVRKKTIYVNSITVPSGLKMSRSRSFQRTLRDSFRQLRRHRSESDQKIEQKPTEQPSAQEGEKSDVKPETTEKAPVEVNDTVEVELKKEETIEEVKKDEETSDKPVEQSEISDKIEKIEEEQKTVTQAEEKLEIELIPTTDETSKDETNKPEAESSSPVKAKPTVVKETVTVMAAVNSLSFANAVLLQGQDVCNTLWVGTVAGHVLIYQLTVPEADKRSEEDVKCVLAKEIHLKHGAPVIGTYVVDRNCHPVTSGVKPAETDASASNAGHRVVVCTQQQIKIFALPSLKANNKYKLAQHDEADSLFVSAQFANFVSKSDEAYSEPDLVCLTNHGRLTVLSVPQLRSQVQTTAMLKQTEDSGAVLSALTTYGGIYYHTSSELKTSSVAAHQYVPRFQVPLMEGMRPIPEPEPEPVASEEPAINAEQVNVEVTDDTTSKTEQVGSGDVEKTVDLSVVSVNDSLAAGDVTADSIKVHVAEESATLAVMVSEAEVSSHKVVETMVHSVKTIGGVTEESKTTTIEEMKKIEGMMSSCTVTSSSTKIEGTTMISSSSVTTVEG